MVRSVGFQWVQLLFFWTHHCLLAGSGRLGADESGVYENRSKIKEQTLRWCTDRTSGNGHGMTGLGPVYARRDLCGSCHRNKMPVGYKINRHYGANIPAAPGDSSAGFIIVRNWQLTAGIIIIPANKTDRTVWSEGREYMADSNRTASLLPWLFTSVYFAVQQRGLLCPLTSNKLVPVVLFALSGLFTAVACRYPFCC